MEKLDAIQYAALLYIGKNPGWNIFYDEHFRHVVKELEVRGLVEIDEHLDAFRITTAGLEAYRYSTKGIE